MSLFATIKRRAEEGDAFEGTGSCVSAVKDIILSEVGASIRGPFITLGLISESPAAFEIKLV